MWEKYCHGFPNVAIKASLFVSRYAMRKSAFMGQMFRQMLEIVLFDALV